MSHPTDYDSADSQRRESADVGLPPVQPPSAGFILQLFVIPGVIVFVIIMVWLTFHWLAHMGTNPTVLIQEMRENKANSWQLAYNLSEELRQNEAYRNDPELAKELAGFLNDLLDRELPQPDEKTIREKRDPASEEVARRGFLCKALGELDIVDDALPVLIRAASDHENDEDLRVRLAALEAIALLAEKMRDNSPIEDDKLLPLLLAGSEHDDHKIATRAVFALAAVGSDAALDRLEEIVVEPHHVDVHYNAATGLARNGKIACLELLEEMLDPDQQRALAKEPTEFREFKRTMILMNALQATSQLAAQDPQADLTSLQRAVNQLLESEENQQIRVQAKSTLRELQPRRTQHDG